MRGRYELEEVLSASSATTVWRAHDRLLRRPVVVKEVAAAAPTGTATGLLTAARVTARVHHPLVASVLDVDLPPSGDPRVVTALVDGPSLVTATSRRGVLPARTGLAVLLDVAAALLACHAAGVVHGDLAPGNVVLDRRGRAHLVDLVGAGPHRVGERVTGTPGFIPPERWDAEPETAAADVYALGCLVVHVLTGRSPFADDDDAATALRQARRTAPSVAALLPGAPRSLVGAVQGCLARDPAERPPLHLVRDALLEAHDATQDVVAPAPASPSDDLRTRHLEGAGVARGVVAPAGRRRARRPGRTGRSLTLVAVLTAGFFSGALVRGLADAPATASAPTATPVTARFVPDVRGLDEDTARALLREAGVRAEGRRGTAGALPIGRVVGTEPGAGARLAGGPVTLLVSSGRSLAQVPELRGGTLQDALPALAAHDLHVGRLERRDGPASLDAVLDTRPLAGRGVASGSAVDLVVASGATLVPRVVGLPGDRAAAALRDAGLVAVVVAGPDGTTPSTARVVAVGAPEGSRVQVGSRLALTLEDPAPTAVPTPDAAG